MRSKCWSPCVWLVFEEPNYLRHFAAAGAGQPHNFHLINRQGRKRTEVSEYNWKEKIDRKRGPIV